MAVILQCGFLNYNILNVENGGLCLRNISDHVLLQSNKTQPTNYTDVYILTAA